MANYPGANVELLIIAIGCGSLFLSHLNDGGFWIVKDCLGLTVSGTRSEELEVHQQMAGRAGRG